MKEEIGVVGLGSFGGGLGLTRELLKRSYRVKLFEKRPLNELENSLSELAPWKDSLSVVTGEHHLQDFDGLATVYLNPAVPWHGSLANDLREKKISLSSDLELFFKDFQKPVIGITGTNGKSTCWEILKRLLPDWALGGNRGVSVFEMNADTAPGAILELSSFQLERIEPHCDVSIVTSLSPDHLDHHEGFENYKKAKERITQFQKNTNLSIFGRDIESWPVPSRKLQLSSKRGDDLLCLEKDILIFPDGFRLSLKKFPLLGSHNQDLLALALAAAREMLQSDARLEVYFNSLCEKGMSSLPHRQEIVSQKPYLIIDDSKATTPESTLCALKAFRHSKKQLYLICGGVEKNLSLNSLVEFLSDSPIKVYVIGEGQNRWAEEAQGKNFSIFLCNTLENSLELIFKEIQEGDTILLSPATSSYDQFRDYRERGNCFQELVSQFYG